MSEAHVIITTRGTSVDAALFDRAAVSAGYTKIDTSIANRSQWMLSVLRAAALQQLGVSLEEWKAQRDKESRNKSGSQPQTTTRSKSGHAGKRAKVSGKMD